MSWYANLKIKYKLFVGYTVVVAISCIIGFHGLGGMLELKRLFDDTHDNLMLSIVRVADADHHAQQHKREVLRFLGAVDEEVRQAIMGRIGREENQIKDALEKIAALPLQDGEQRLYNALVLAWETYRNEAGRILSTATRSDRKSWSREQDQLAPLFSELERLTSQLREFNQNEADEHYHSGALIYEQLRARLIVLSVGLIILAVTIAVVITRSVTVPLLTSLTVIRGLAERGEEKSRLAEAIANGDLTQDVTPSKGFVIEPAALNSSETGELLKSVASMDDSQNTLDLAFARMTKSLRQSREQDLDNDWLKTGLYDLNSLMRGDQRVPAMADKILTFLAEYLKAGAGAFYLYDEQGQTLVLAATYALTRRKNLGDRFQLGEGLIGQAAIEKKMICLTNVPPDYLPIGSALGEGAPCNVAAFPLVHNDQLVAALELGSFTAFSDLEMDFLNQAMEGIAIGLGVAHSRQRINELLEETQQQTEELRVQQEELQQSNEELEERAEMLEQRRKEIQEKNQEIELASGELQRKAAELEKISAYKSDFLANMSHELRTPLNSMMLLSSLLSENREGTLTDKQQEFAVTINNAGKDLLNLINDILDLAKVEAGRLELHYEEIPVSTFCGQLESMFRPLVAQKNLEFRIDVSPETPESMRMDEQRSLQVVKNLLSNAIKFTEQGSIQLEISTPATSPLSGAAVAFCVKDTGIGIAPEKQDLVFQAFQQADGSTSRRFGGTGLGLSISLQLARRMGGEITLTSEPDHGSVFTFYLPLTGVPVEEEEQPTMPQVKQVDNTPQAPAQPGQNDGGAMLDIPQPLPDDRDALHRGDKSILVVEDDLNFAKTMMSMIREKGFGCLVAADGASGIHLAEFYQPSAIILDVLLPGMDGWAVMRGIKDNAATRHIPVHFITCLDERQKAMAMGAVGFVTKPVSSVQLEEVFETIENRIAKQIKKLLIVEDNPDEAEGMTALLQDRNLDIVVAATGKEAMEILGREPVDCVVLDLGLSDMSGFDLLDHINHTENLRNVPVIIHTGRDLSHEEEVHLQRYAKSIIIKGAKSPERLLNEVTLFLHMVESDLPPEKQRMIRTSLDKEAMLEGKKVLIVDDDMRNIFSLSSVLSDKHMDIIEAENGQEALSKVQDNPEIDIVLMDIMMPEMDGYEAIRAIRSDPRFKDLPIIAMTAKVLKGDQEKCLQAGANDYIAKPLDIEKLLSLLRVWLYRQA